MPVTLPAIPPIVRHVRDLDGNLFLVREVANALGISPATVRRVAEIRPDLRPSAITMFGDMLVPLFTLEDLTRLDRYVAERRASLAAARRRSAGRPRLWSDSERRARRARHCAASYRRRCARALTEAGDLAAAQAAARAAAEIRDHLQQVHDDRAALIHSGIMTAGAVAAA
jgi:hypothetical protein